MYSKRKFIFYAKFISLTLWLFTAFSQRLDGRRSQRAQVVEMAFISLKNGSFKEPLLSVHFACALGMRCPWAVSLLQEREGATYYETANG